MPQERVQYGELHGMLTVTTIVFVDAEAPRCTKHDKPIMEARGWIDKDGKEQPFNEYFVPFLVHVREDGEGWDPCTAGGPIV